MKILKNSLVKVFIKMKLYKLPEILETLSKKMPDLDHNLVLKSLTYFDDIEEEKILFKNDNDTSIKEISTYIEKEAKKIK